MTDNSSRIYSLLGNYSCARGLRPVQFAWATIEGFHVAFADVPGHRRQVRHAQLRAALMALPVGGSHKDYLGELWVRVE